MSIFISHANGRDIDEIERAAARKRRAMWTVPAGATRGSRIVFYASAPVSAFMAEGFLDDDRLRDGANYGWPGKKYAYVRVTRIFDTSLHIRLARKLFRDWGWLKSPISGSAVPPKYESRFLSLISEQGNEGETADELAALEGASRLRMVRHRKREAWKRNEKLQDALNRTGRLACEVRGCGFDFLKRYGELGRGYAQVHHRKALSDATGPRQTRLRDLAIVCANCHAMIHFGGKCRRMDDLISRRGR